MMMRQFALSLLTAAIILCSAPPVLRNGSFEAGTGAASDIGFGTRCYATGLCDGKTGGIAGWEIAGDVDYIGAYWRAQDGGRSLDLSGAGTGGVSQAFATIPGAVYTVFFWQSGNPDKPGIRTLIVEAAGQSAVFSFDTAGSSHENMGWVRRAWAFQTTASATTLTFRTEDVSFGPAIDNVSIEALASPACPACPACGDLEIWTDRFAVRCPDQPFLCNVSSLDTTWFARTPIQVLRGGIVQVHDRDFTFAPRVGITSVVITWVKPLVSGEIIELRYPLPWACALFPGTVVPQKTEIWIDRQEIRCRACSATRAETTWPPRGEVEVYRDGIRQINGIHYTETPIEYFPGAHFGKRRFSFTRPFASGEVIELRYPVPRGARYTVLALEPGNPAWAGTP